MMLHRLPSHANKNIWAIQLESVIHNKLIRKIKKEESDIALKQNGDIIINVIHIALKNIFK